MLKINQVVYLHGVYSPEDDNNLVLLGRNLSIIPGEPADEVYMSTSGRLTIVERSSIMRDRPTKFISFRASDYADEMRGWNMKRLDAAVADYTYSAEGQAMLVIDVMCRAGKLSYKDKESFSDKVNKAFGDGSFLLIIKET